MIYKLAIFLAVFSSCSSASQESSTPVSRDFLLLLDDEDILLDSSIDKGVYQLLSDLSRCNSAEAIKKISTLRSVDSSYFNGFKFYQSADSISGFLLYRLAEYIGDVDQNTLMRILLNSRSEVNSQSLKEIIDIEHNFLTLFNRESIDKSTIELIRKKRELYPGSLRLRYLWSVLASKTTDSVAALDTLSQLFSRGYYSKPIYRLMTSRPKSTNSDIVLGKTPFCDECLVPYQTDVEKMTLTDNLATKCLSSPSAKDSMTAVLINSYKKLNERKFSAVDSIFQIHSNRNDKFPVDPFKAWEHGEYIDLYLKKLFLQKKYRDLVNYIKNDMELNEKIIVLTKADLFKLISRYYTQYINSNASESEIRSFFDTKFDFVASSI